MRRLGVVVAVLAISGVAYGAAHVLRASEPEPLQPIELRPPARSAPETANTPPSVSKPKPKPKPTPTPTQERPRARANEQAAPPRAPARPPSAAPPRTRVTPVPTQPTPRTGGDDGSGDEPTDREESPDPGEDTPDADDDGDGDEEDSADPESDD